MDILVFWECDHLKRTGKLRAIKSWPSVVCFLTWTILMCTFYNKSTQRRPMWWDTQETTGREEGVFWLMASVHGHLAPLWRLWWGRRLCWGSHSGAERLTSEQKGSKTEKEEVTGPSGSLQGIPPMANFHTNLYRLEEILSLQPTEEKHRWPEEPQT